MVIKVSKEFRVSKVQSVQPASLVHRGLSDLKVIKGIRVISDRSVLLVVLQDPREIPVFPVS
jgi:hypothetical protein